MGASQSPNLPNLSISPISQFSNPPISPISESPNLPISQSRILQSPISESPNLTVRPNPNPNLLQNPPNLESPQSPISPSTSNLQSLLVIRKSPQFVYHNLPISPSSLISRVYSVLCKSAQSSHQSLHLAQFITPNSSKLGIPEAAKSNRPQVAVFSIARSGFGSCAWTWLEDLWKLDALNTLLFFV